MQKRLKLKETEIIRQILSNKYTTNYKSTINAISSLSSEGFEKLDPYQQLEAQNFFNIQDKINTIFVSALKTFQDLHKYPFETTLLEDNSDYRKWLITQSKETKKKLFIVQRAETLSKLLKSKIEKKDFTFQCSNTFTLEVLNIIFLTINHSLVKEGQWIEQGITLDRTRRNHGRENQLSTLIFEILDKSVEKYNKFPSYKDLLVELVAISKRDSKVVQEVTDDKILWLDRRKNEKTTKLTTLRSGYSKLKKKYNKNNKKIMVLVNP